MEEIIIYLCPNNTIEDVRKHCELVKQYLYTKERAVHTSCVVENDFSMSTLACPVCGNTNENYTVTEYAGEIICIGRDGYGCGGVMGANNLQVPFNHATDMVEHSSLYSQQGNFESSYSNRGGVLGKCNQLVEKNVQKFENPDHLMTSEKYKNGQRSNVYDMLEEMKIVTSADPEWVERVKFAFHEYRSRMSRIHKLPLVLACLFFLTEHKN